MHFSERTQIRRILLLAANPDGSPALHLDEELRHIKDSLKQSDSRDRFDVQVEPAVTISHIRRALLEHKPEIVHFCGHGAGEDGIVCKDDLGQMKLVPTTALSNLFRLVSGHVKCVVLNACFAEVQANEIVRHIDFVVGMKYAIGDIAALRFADGFYDALFAGKSFRQCFEFGVNAIQLENIPEDLTPVMKVKEKPQTVAKEKAKKRPKTVPAFNNKQKTNKSALGSPGDAHSHGVSPVYFNSQNDKTGEASIMKISKKSFWALISIAVVAIVIGSVAIVMRILRNDATTPTPVEHSDMVGIYRQELEQGKPDEAGKPNPQIQSHEVETLLYVFVDPATRQLKARELTFWKVYYVPDKHPEKRFLISSYIADWGITVIDASASLVKMRGSYNSRNGLDAESRAGEQPLSKDITDAFEENRRALNERFRSAYFELTLEAGGKLVRYKWYNDEEKDPKNKGTRETFIRQ